ncbi:rod shape-determining protein MreC [Dyella mobilis]|uniref:Cell shape-determining protein MreC n=1 Tax=Dyella mobilis TaxID=1849582 RepID=A0ABS2KMW1_9GAMM|nr:rod shape-determining protein MreC [Dyella mobilis]MBM7132304.1 rod shape-determining protein MreC [Dyella mobilis]GLQ95709.1 cell shape-determining protein MreC [Dyella mobilis]
MPLTREESSPLFAGTAAGTLRLIFYLAMAMVLMVLDHRNGWLWRMRYATAIVVEPVYRLVSLPADGAHELGVAFADRRMLTEQNQRLREDLLLANAKLNRMAAVAQQNQRLKELLDTQHSLELHVQLARVIGVDMGAFRHRMMINLGARDGIKTGQPVIDAHGVMGQIIDVLPNSASVMLVTDPDHALPVMVERTGLRTIAYGSRNGEQLTLPTIPMAADVRAGDKLLTSGLGGRFPEGFPVGEISAVAPAASGMFLEAHANPSADLDRSDEVLVLHDLAEPAGPPPPPSPAGPPSDEAPVPAPASTAALPRPAILVKPAPAHSASTPAGVPQT